MNEPALQEPSTNTISPEDKKIMLSILLFVFVVAGLLIRRYADLGETGFIIISVFAVISALGLWAATNFATASSVFFGTLLVIKLVLPAPDYSEQQLALINDPRIDDIYIIDHFKVDNVENDSDIRWMVLKAVAIDKSKTTFVKSELIYTIDSVKSAVFDEEPKAVSFLEDRRSFSRAELAKLYQADTLIYVRRD